jgi:serine/threonine-protein kinase
LSTLGPYEILRPLAVGGQAEILLGERSGPGGFRVRHALKVLKVRLDSQSPETIPSARALIAEARLLVGLAHPHTLAIHGLEVIDDRLVMVLEYVGGRSLATVLERLSHSGQTIGVEHALWITRCVASALHRAHELSDDEDRPLNVVHRDVNPQNILLGFDGRVKLIDFGIAISRIASRDTRLGMVKGKPGFMSPEQAYGLDDIDRRTDIYSLGLVLYEMLTGVRPLAGTVQEALQRARNADFPEVRQHCPDLSAEISEIVSSALARQPNDRFSTARQMASHCSDALHRTQQDYLGDELGEYLQEILAQELLMDQRVNAGPSRGTQVLPVGDVGAGKSPEPTLRQSLMQSVYDLVSDRDAGKHTPAPEPPPLADVLPVLAPEAELYGDLIDDEPVTMREGAGTEPDEDSLDLDELLRAIEDIYDRRSGKTVSPDEARDDDGEGSTQVYRRDGHRD